MKNNINNFILQIMKRIVVHLLSCLAIALIAGCSNDNLADAPDVPSFNEGDGVYMSVRVVLPKAPGTRSYTDGDNSSSDGTEVGKDPENFVSNIWAVLTKADNSFIAAGEVTKENGNTQNPAPKEYSGSMKISKTQLNSFYTDPSVQNTTGNKTIRVFTFCNPTNDLIDALEACQYGNTDWINTSKTINSNESGIWGKNNFLMANRDIAERTIPATLADWNAYNETNPFNLSGNNGTSNIDNGGTGKGAILVERAVARFDFKDGSGTGTSENTYHVIYQKQAANGTDSEETTDVPLIDIELGKMALVNMNNTFYYLRRVSDNGLPKGTGFGICGPEKTWYNNAKGNYVVDCYATDKYNGISNNFGNYFIYPFFGADGTTDNSNVSSDRWGTSLISDVLKKEEDNPEWTKESGYHIWRYVTENTIPGEEGKQVNGISTGIVFKGKMKVANGVDINSNSAKDILTTINNNTNTEGRNTDTDPILYYFRNNLYYTWVGIKEAANEEYKLTNNLKAPLVRAVYGENAKYNETDKKLEGDNNSANAHWNAWKPYGVGGAAVESEKQAFKEAATKAGITLYQSSYDKDLGGWGYYCYYYYWNRHNDNGENGIMGPMEFAVVRNNVYKLSVTKISRIGHPRIPENDPDKPNPDTPDEQNDLYITLSVKVLPWVVRVNNIEF